jgi:hypothetical protein
MRDPALQAPVYASADDPPDDPDFAFSLCNARQGLAPSRCSVSLSELESVRGPFGLGIERDRDWTPKRTLLGYATRLSSFAVTSRDKSIGIAMSPHSARVCARTREGTSLFARLRCTRSATDTPIIGVVFDMTALHVKHLPRPWPSTHQGAAQPMIYRP